MTLFLIDAMPYRSGIWDWINVIPSHFGLIIKRFAPNGNRTWKGTQQTFHTMFHTLLLEVFD